MWLLCPTHILLCSNIRFNVTGLRQHAPFNVTKYLITRWAALHALFITHLNNSYYSFWVFCWFRVSVTFRAAAAQPPPLLLPGCRWKHTGSQHSCIAEPLHSPSKGFKDWEPTLSDGQGKAHLSQLCSIKEKMWWPFTFFTVKKTIPWGKRGGGRFKSLLILWLMSTGLSI